MQKYTRVCVCVYVCVVCVRMCVCCVYVSVCVWFSYKNSCSGRDWKGECKSTKEDVSFSAIGLTIHVISSRDISTSDTSANEDNSFRNHIR